MRFFSPQGSDGGRWKLDRLAAFSDGVIAIVMTLLVLGLQVPSSYAVPEPKLTDYLMKSVIPICSYVLSFALIGMYWMQHYAIFHCLTHANRPFVLLNLLFLLCLSFLPFPTGVHAVYLDDELAVVLYGVAQALCGLSLLALWLYATRNHRLVSKDIPAAVVTRMTRRLAVTPVLCVVAIAASFVNPWLSRLTFLVVACCYFSLRPIDQGSVESHAGEQ